MDDSKIQDEPLTKEEIDYEYKQTLLNYSIVASAIGFIPFLPISDFWILTPLQLSMLARLSRLYNFKLDAEEFLKMTGATVGLGLTFKTVSVVLNRFIPFLGWVINAGVAFSGTYALGILAKHYIEADGKLSQETIKDIWEKSYAEGKEEFESLKKYILEKKDEILKDFKKYTDTEDENIDSTFTTKNENDIKDVFEEENKPPKKSSKKQKNTESE
jgi:uncharacterized protein (DUF697 family)